MFWRVSSSKSTVVKRKIKRLLANTSKQIEHFHSKIKQVTKKGFCLF
jgi:hypothetical protein